MIISHEQALLAAQQLNRPCMGHECAGIAAVSDETIAAAHAVVDQTPDMRADRMVEARAFLHSPEFTSHEVAEKMISRIISDSLR